MPADLVAVAILVVLATLAAPLAADCRRRLATRRLRTQPAAPHRRGQRAAPARAGSLTRTAMTSPAGGVRRPRADRRSRASSTARV